jgi:hypothetical protein
MMPSHFDLVQPHCLGLRFRKPLERNDEHCGPIPDFQPSGHHALRI